MKFLSNLFILIVIMQGCSPEPIGGACPVPFCALPQPQADTTADFSYSIEPLCVVQPRSGATSREQNWKGRNDPSVDTLKAYLPITSWMKCPNGTKAMAFVDSVKFFQREASGEIEMKITTHRADPGFCSNGCYVELVPILDTFYIVDSLFRFQARIWSQPDVPKACECEAVLRFKLLE